MLSPSVQRGQEIERCALGALVVVVELYVC